MGNDEIILTIGRYFVWGLSKLGIMIYFCCFPLMPLEFNICTICTLNSKSYAFLMFLSFTNPFLGNLYPFLMTYVYIRYQRSPKLVTWLNSGVYEKKTRINIVASLDKTCSVFEACAGTLLQRSDRQKKIKIVIYILSGTKAVNLSVSAFVKIMDKLMEMKDQMS